MGLFQLVYSSQAAEDIGYTDILSILRQARASNSLLEITGVLIYRDGSFLQLLEGDEKQIRQLIARIFKDSRHHTYKTIIESQAVERIFPEFSMAYFDGDISGKGTLEVDFIIETIRQGAKAEKKILDGFKFFKNSEPKFVI